MLDIAQFSKKIHIAIVIWLAFETHSAVAQGEMDFHEYSSIHVIQNFGMGMMPLASTDFVGSWKYKYDSTIHPDPTKLDWKCLYKVAMVEKEIKHEDPLPGLDDHTDVNKNVAAMLAGNLSVISEHVVPGNRESKYFPTLTPGKLAYFMGSPSGKSVGAVAHLEVEAYCNYNPMAAAIGSIQFKHAGGGDALRFKLKNDSGLGFWKFAETTTRGARSLWNCIVEVNPDDAEGGWYPLAIYVDDQFQTYTYVYIQP